MDVEKYIERKKAELKLKEKVLTDRISLEQSISWLFRPLALFPFPPQSLGKRLVIDSEGNESEEYEILMQRKSGYYEYEILAHPHYGVPYGQDVLIILYLVHLAYIQKSRHIRINFYREYMKFWDMNPESGKKYRLVKESLNRIRNSKYKIVDTKAETIEDHKEIEHHYLFIDELNLICMPKKAADQPKTEDQYILLSERFYNEIKKHKIPYNLDAIKILKSKPAYLNFHILMSVRTAQLNKKRKELKAEMIELFIPYFTSDGLQFQLSTRIKRRPNFRQLVSKWLEKTKELWPLCPITIEGDGLLFVVNSDKQLDVQIKPIIEIARAAREIKAGSKTDIKCTKCGDKLEMREGKEDNKGKKMPDFLRCNKCKKNYYQRDYPELFKEVNHG